MIFNFRANPMHERIGQDSQFIIATHSPIMAYPVVLMYELPESAIRSTIKSPARS